MEKHYSQYGVACVQVATPSAHCKADVTKAVDHCLEMIRWAVAQNANYGFPVKLVVLPECSMNGFPYCTNQEYLDAGVFITDPGPELDLFIALAKELDILICTGSGMENDPKYPAHIFNTIWIVGPTGKLLRYRKMTPWVPDEGSTSPAQLKSYDEEFFPVVDTPLGKLGVINCYDTIFPENSRQLAFNGCEVLLRPSAYMAPFVNNDPMDWWKITSQCRSLENVMYGIHCNQGANLHEMTPFDFPGGSLICDYEGRILSETRLGGDRIVYGHINIDELRAWRANTYQHMGICHVRKEAYTYLDKPIYPCKTHGPNDPITMEQTISHSDAGRKVMGWDKK
jgi:predicted amidohydrolase